MNGSGCCSLQVRKYDSKWVNSKKKYMISQDSDFRTDSFNSVTLSRTRVLSIFLLLFLQHGDLLQSSSHYGSKIIATVPGIAFNVTTSSEGREAVLSLLLPKKPCLGSPQRLPLIGSSWGECPSLELLVKGRIAIRSLNRWISRIVPGNRRSNITWELVRNADSWAPPQTYWIRNSVRRTSRLRYKKSSR